MQLAQKLYEGVQLSDGKVAGLITYIRTDGLNVCSLMLMSDSVELFDKKRVIFPFSYFYFLRFILCLPKV